MTRPHIVEDKYLQSSAAELRFLYPFIAVL